MSGNTAKALGALAAVGGGLYLLSRSGDAGETAENIAMYPSADGGGYTFEASAPGDVEAQWTLTPAEGEAIEFTGNRVSRSLEPGTYAVTVVVGDRTFTTDLIIGAGV